MRETYYDILEVSTGASAETITAAYRSLIRRHHPDKVGPDKLDRAQAINSAYQVLSDAQRRVEYDAQLSCGEIEQAPFDEPDAPGRGGDFVVSPGSPGEAIIGAAIAAAAPGSRIQVRPGIYHESLNLDRNVEIIGDGPVDGIVIHSTKGCCIEMRTDNAVVRGLTLRCRAAAEGGEEHAVWVPRGKLLIEDCDISSDSFSNVSVSGEGTSVDLRRCRIHDGNQCGVMVSEGAGGRIEDCDISANGLAGWSGVFVGSGATPHFVNCRISDGAGFGVVAEDGAKGLFEQCEIAANRGIGVLVRDRADTTFQQCLVRDNRDDENKARGVWVRDHGLGRFDNCRVSGHAIAVQISSGSTPTLYQCTLEDNSESGLLVNESGLGTVLNCDIARCELSALICSNGAPTLKQCTLRDSNVGAAFTSNACGEFERCEIFASGDRGVMVTEQSDPLFRRCIIHDNAKFGVGNFNNGCGTFEHCDIYRNGETGVGMEGASESVFRHCTIRQNGELGVYASNGAGGRVEHCNLTGNRNGPILVHQSHTLDLDNRTDGVIVSYGGSAGTAAALREDPYLDGLEHSRRHDNVYFTDMETLIGLIEAFTLEQMPKWQKREEQISPDGTRFTTTFALSETHSWQLRERTMRSRLAMGVRAFGGGELHPSAAVPYQLEARFDLHSDQQRPWRIDLLLQVDEHIDPQRSVRDFPLGEHFLAPSWLHTEGYFGLGLDDFLSSRLLP
jgi:nitrous oxidase accessory protein NosD